MEKHGLMNFIVHPDYIRGAREQSVYEELLTYLATLRDDKNVWIPTSSEVNRWWRQRREMKLVPESDGWRIEGEGNYRARIAYASEHDGQLVYSLTPQSQRHSYCNLGLNKRIGFPSANLDSLLCFESASILLPLCRRSSPPTYAVGLISVVVALFLPIRFMASGTVVRPPTSVKATPTALRWSLVNLLESKRPMPTPSATRVPAISMISASVRFRSIMSFSAFLPATHPAGKPNSFDAQAW